LRVRKVLAGAKSRYSRVPQVAVLRDLCFPLPGKIQVCEYADLWHPDRTGLI